ncbi:hypothetical protein EJD97_006916, partial [Solanum chilense]
NTQREASRRDKEGVANVGEHDNQVPPQEEVAIDDQVPANPPSMVDGDIRAAFLQMDKAITTQEQAITTQPQAMTAIANQEVVPRGNQVRTPASRLRDFIRMNPLTFYGSKVEEYPQEFID